MLNEHPDAVELARLLDGELGPAEAETRLGHLASCDTCLDLTDSLWASRGGVFGTSETEQPMSEHSAQIIELRLFRRIHAAGAGSQMAWLMTDGFVQVIVEMMRPIVCANPQRDSNRGVPR